MGKSIKKRLDAVDKILAIQRAGCQHRNIEQVIVGELDGDGGYFMTPRVYWQCADCGEPIQAAPYQQILIQEGTEYRRPTFEELKSFAIPFYTQADMISYSSFTIGYLEDLNRPWGKHRSIFEVWIEAGRPAGYILPPDGYVQPSHALRK